MQCVSVNQMIEEIKKKNLCRKSYILVGANPKGRVLMHKLREMGISKEQIQWTDRRYRFFQEYELPVSNPLDLNPKKVDYILIADTQNCSWWENIAADIGIDGLSGYQIDEIDCEFTETEYMTKNFTDHSVEEWELIRISPIELVGEMNLDIVVRYMACLELMEGKNGRGMEYYKKIVRTISNAEKCIRPMTTCAYFSEPQVKIGYQTFKESFQKLIESMEEKGFDKAHFIPISETMQPLNGRHRLSVALALGIDVYAKQYIGFGEPFFRYAAEDLLLYGFVQKEIDEIVEKYYALKGKLL